jgi:FtsH-binding integral membrane protein
MSNDSRYTGGSYAADQYAVRPAAALSTAFLSQAFMWMFLGLLLSAFIAFLVQNGTTVTPYGVTGGLAETVINLWLPLIIAEMVIGIGLQVAITKINALTALALFFVYAALNGLTFGVIVMAVEVNTGTSATVFEAFVCASAMFGGAALYGAVTKRSLTNMFGYLAMATWGLFVAILLNLLLNNGVIDTVISIAGVIIFTALTASTVQRIARGQFAAMTGSMEKASVLGALLLYLEFVNIFLFLLRLFGGGGRR